jgi:hypothetical protein
VGTRDRETRIFRAATVALCAVICAVGTPPRAGAKARYITIDLGPRGTSAGSVNARGFVAGTYGNDGGFVRGPKGKITSFSISGAEQLFVEGVNSHRSIAGFYGTTQGVGFLRKRDGTIATFDPSGMETTTVWGINDKETVTGGWFDSNFKQHGFLGKANGRIHSFDVEGAAETEGKSINTIGDISGTAVFNNEVDGFLRTADRTAVFACPDSVETHGLYINDADTVAGYCFSDAGSHLGYHGYIRTADGTITTFDPPDSQPQTYLTGINNLGAVTGYYDDDAGLTHGYVRSPSGQIEEFDVPDAVNGTFPASINDAGVIVGSYETDSNIYGFVRTP